MAKYRQIQETFWEDTKVIEEMTPEDRYFYLYLLTNPHTTQSGCYEISIKQMSNETGYNHDTIEKLLESFENKLKIIKYSKDTKELLIINWSKYNWTSSQKVLKCIFNDLNTIKNKEFYIFLKELLIGYGYGIDTDSQIEKEKEEEKEIEKKEINKEKNIVLNDIYSYIEKSFNRLLSSSDYSLIENWLKIYDFKILKYSVDISLEQKINSLNYVDGILKNWYSQKLKTYDEIINFQKKFKQKISRKKNNIELFESLGESINVK